jgi:MinD-like ATPase involved in chromosome partitioning or flagellar assembly
VTRVAADPALALLRRCVDVADLLAAASAGQADVAVVALGAPGLDATAVEQLQRFRVRVVAVVPPGPAESHRLRAARLGIGALVAEDDLAALVAAVRDEEQILELAEPATDATDAPAGSPGRVVAVWGPGGAPGRTSVAAAVASELAARRRRTTLVDADPYGGSVAQQLGILDEVSGLLAAARLATAGALQERFGSVQRSIGDRLTVVTGLPRADRWVEVRVGALEHLLDVAAASGDVVVDTGFSLEADPLLPGDLGSRPPRNHLTLAALERADEVVVVGAADPVGLARLARALVDLGELGDPVTGVPVRVVVNRMRASLGWSEREVSGLVDGFVPLAGVHFLPDDTAVADRALLAGRTWTESGDSALRRAVAALVDAVAPETVAPRGGRRAGRGGGRRVRPRRAGRARRS